MAQYESLTILKRKPYRLEWSKKETTIYTGKIAFEKMILKDHYQFGIISMDVDIAKKKFCWHNKPYRRGLFLRFLSVPAQGHSDSSGKSSDPVPVVLR